MSDPMTNSEVEDVLSSIRRLVSDEKRVEPDAPDGQKAGTDRLVLTPSLRVAEDDAPDTISPEATAQPDPADGDETTARLGDTDMRAPKDTSPSEPLILGDALDMSNATPDPSPAHSDDHSDAATAQFAEQAFKSSDAGPRAAEADMPETLGDKIAALETLIAGRSEDWEPDQAGTGANAGTEPPAMHWEEADDKDPVAHPASEQDTFEAIPLDETAQSFEHSPEPEQRPAALPHDHAVDQDALRALVGEIVRQELQGPLGDRITRNVRKLVRRELHRALTAKDLE